ncbi:putative membrane protein [Granulicella aggregans]|uniref:Putative membrane protein n=1 Tax=Granulicella aggregans TaxID=474949 RepID=A0A7W7ZB14_9BACT|nr:DUF2339 domain-containing protein [Granulicella aggregans]MBB5056601.1 putative membrane protein [Granulicella aggregans]
MAPEDLSPTENPSDSTSDAGSDVSVKEIEYLGSQVKSLTERVFALEQAISDMGGSKPAIMVPPPPPLPAVSRARFVSRTVPNAGSEASGASETTPRKPPRSLEDRLGSQIFNRVGIIALLIGATWFLKLAMDNHWIGALGRVLIGLIAGAGIVVWSERFRRREFAAFSYSLKAVGTGVLYLSLWASFQLYHLLPPEAAFALMLLVTLWNAWMAWAQQSELLAAYAIAGGFATPILLSTGGNHEIFLFSYLLTLDIATIALVRLSALRSKSWSRLLMAALPGTIVYFIGWYVRFYAPAELASTSVFIAIFFIAFLTLPFRLGSREPVPAVEAEPIQDVLLPLMNAVFASLAFYSVLEDSGNHASLPWVSLLFAAIYLVAMRLPALSRMQTAAARAVHLSLAVLFLTIAIPLKASGRWITIGWLAEGVALLWVSARLSQTETAEDKSGAAVHRMLRRLASLALALGFFGLLITPFWLDSSIQTAVFNRRFVTEAAGILAFAVAAWISWLALRANGPSENVAQKDQTSVFPSWLQLAGTSVVALNLIALQAGVIEIQTFWTRGTTCYYCGEIALQTALSISAFLMVYGAGLLAAGFWKHSAFLRWQGLGLLVIAILKTFLYDVRSLSQGYRVASFLGLGALLMAVSFAYVRRDAKASPPDRQ